MRWRSNSRVWYRDLSLAILRHSRTCRFSCYLSDRNSSNESRRWRVFVYTLITNMPCWFKFVALFLVAFMLFDVCAPEPCEAQLSAPAQSTSVCQGSHDGSGSGSCQFEEDCFNCAHYAPGTMFLLQPSSVSLFVEPNSFVPSVNRSPLVPYHPPRA